jgi:hypothetical protein
MSVCLILRAGCRDKTRAHYGCKAPGLVKLQSWDDLLAYGLLVLHTAVLG